MTDTRYLYCAIDSPKTVIKIGITDSPTNRAYSLGNVNQKQMKMLYVLEFTGRHYESAEILDDQANYASMPVYGNKQRRNFEAFYKDINSLTRKFELLLKRKFKDYVIHGAEWFPYCDQRLMYVKRIFSALAKSENTALVRTRLYIHE